MWNYGLVGDVDKFDFKAMIAELVCPWISSTKSGLPRIVDVTSHPTTNELLVLNSDSDLFYFKLQDGSPVLNPLVKLHLDSSSQHDKFSLFFAFGLFAGLISDSGIISIYDIYSGVQLSKLEELQGQSVHMWRNFHLMNSVGFWSISGIWKLQSATILEISECIRSAIQPTNFETERADSLLVQGKSNEVCTRNRLLQKDNFFTGKASLEFESASENFVIPELVSDDQETTNESSIINEQSFSTNESIFTGPVFAANHLMKWNINHRAAKLALDSIVCSRILSDCRTTDEEVPGVFLNLLVGKLAQSPAMALALLWEHPVHREFVLHKLELYLSENSDKSPTQKTCLNELLQPYVSEFLSLSKQCKPTTDSSFKEMIKLPSLPTNSIAQEVTSLLEAFSVGPMDMTSLERLSTLSIQYPQQVLDCVSEYLRIDSEQDDSKDSQCEKRWRKIYRFVSFRRGEGFTLMCQLNMYRYVLWNRV